MQVVDKYNTLVGACVALASAVFGQAWLLFAVFLLLNILDWLTGWYKSHKQKRESSEAGSAGVVKKLGYWVIILVSFAVPVALIQLGALVGWNLAFLELFGWFVLASLLVNEARSILENLVETGYNVPPFLIAGLAVTQKLIRSKAAGILPEVEKEEENDHA